MFAVFKKRDFTLLWFSQLISTSGSALTDLAAGILIYRATGSALAVGLMLAATALPALVVGLIAGVFVDRYDRKKIMIVSCLLRAVLVASIPAIVAININLLYVVVFINAAIAQFFDPAQESVIPDVATDEELAAANSFLSISSFGSTAIGFAAAGLLASLASIEIAFYADALTFLVSAALILFVTVRPIVSEEATSVRVVVAGLRDGFRFLSSTPILRNSFISGVPAYFSFGLWNVLLLPFAITVLMATEFEYGLQEGLTSVGFVVGSLFMAKYTDRLREGQWLVIGMLGMGVLGILYGLATSILVAIIIVTLSGFLNAPPAIARRLILQRNSPREMRGRVFSTFGVLRDVIFLIGMFAAGLADYVDIRLLVIISGVILVGTGIWTQFLPGLGEPAAEWRQAAQRLRTATAAGALPSRPLAADDLGVLVGVIPAFGVLGDNERRLLLASARVRDVPAGDDGRRGRRPGRCRVRDPVGSGHCGHAGRGWRVPRAVDDARGRRVRRDRRADRQHADGQCRGRRRFVAGRDPGGDAPLADVRSRDQRPAPAEDDRTPGADDDRRPAAPGGRRPGRVARPAQATTVDRRVAATASRIRGCVVADNLLVAGGIGGFRAATLQ